MRSIGFYYKIIFIAVSRSFFSVQLSQSKDVSSGLVVPFDTIIVNFGDNYIQSGGIYMYV